jgi:hypothetical protein
MAGGPVEREDQDAGTRPLLVTVKGGSGEEESAASSSIAVVVASTAVAGSFEFGISVSTCPSMLPRRPLNRDTERIVRVKDYMHCKFLVSYIFECKTAYLVLYCNFYRIYAIVE